MSSILRLLLGLVLSSVVLAVGGRLIAPCLHVELGMDWWNQSDQYRLQVTEQERAEAMAQQDERLIERINAKSALTEKVIAGQLSLVEAAAGFGNINDMPAEHAGDYRCAFPGASDGEILCHQVIAWVSCELASRSRGHDTLVARLKTELADHLKQHGTVVLPR